MKLDKGLVAGSSTLLVLSLLEHTDLYGYQMIEELARRSNDVFQMKEGTLYPILHGLEKGKYLSSYEQQAPTGRMRKYYRLTRRGRELLADKKTEWAREWRMCCPAGQMPFLSHKEDNLEKALLFHCGREEVARRGGIQQSAGGAVAGHGHSRDPLRSGPAGGIGGIGRPPGG